MSSLLVVPIRGIGRPVGALRVWRERPDRTYTDHELAVLERLVESVAAGL